MYHWNIEALCNDLAKERLPEPQAMMYLLNTTIVITIPIYGYTTMSQPWVLWAEFFMGIAGILLAYYFNGGAKGKDFLARLASIGWVSTIRVLAFSIIIMIIYILLLKIFSESPQKTPGTIDFTASVVNIFYWASVIKYINISASLTPK